MTELTTFEQQLPMVVSRGIDEPTWLTLKNSIFPGAADESIIMVLDYCKSRGLDPLMKPVHIVPMSIKDGNGYKMRDVVMPGINTYRVMASRSGDLAGTNPPIFGPDITSRLGSLDFTYPEFCEVTVSKKIGNMLVDFTAREYYLENYAIKKRGDDTPNAMWQKRPKGQLAKCAEAQALRKGWPEIGQQPTYEEMEGKHTEKLVNPGVNPATNILIDSLPTAKTAQEIYDQACDGMEAAAHPGELQQAFGEGWKQLKALAAGNEMKTLQDIYEEIKAKFEALESE